jgi:uncharacterized protein
MGGPRFVARRSGIHGRGVFARVDLGAEELLAEYRGERIDWAQACRRYEQAGVEGHTFLFDLGDGTVIDGGVGGNGVRWVNHGCRPNCEAVEWRGRIWIQTLRAVPAGSELLIDYALIADQSDSPGADDPYVCRCGARSCRGSMRAVG